MLLEEKFLHLLHVWGNVGVKHVITSAECVETGVTSFRLVEAVLRALAIASEEIFASQALARQGVALAYAETRLGGSVHHFSDS